MKLSVMLYSFFIFVNLFLISSQTFADDGQSALKAEGDRHYYLGEYGVAIDSYEKALEISPNYLEAKFGLGKAKFQKEAYKEAASYFLASAEQRSMRGASLYNAALSFRMIGECHHALKLYEEFLNTTNDKNYKVMAFYGAAICYEAQGQIAQAAKYYGMFLETSKFDPIFANWQRVVSTRREQLLTGKYSNDELANSTNIRALYMESVELLKTKKFDKASKILNRALQIDPNYFLALVARAGANIGLGKFAYAINDYEKALQLNPQSASPLFGLGEAYRGLGDSGKAKVYYSRYLTSDQAKETPELSDNARRFLVALEKSGAAEAATGIIKNQPPSHSQH